MSKRQAVSHVPSGRRGVTLLEMVLSMGILVVVSSMTYWFYASALTTGERSTDGAYRLRLVRVVLDRLATEIRQAAAVTVDDRVGITGEPERILLSSYRVPGRKLVEERERRDEPLPGEYDVTKVEYKIARHPEVLDEEGYEYALGLARNEIRVPRPLPVQTADEFDDEAADEEESQPEEEVTLEDDFLLEGDEAADVDLGPDINWEELYAPEIRYLRFCYFDGSRWWDSWAVTGESPLPQLVQVTIGFEGHPPFGEETGVRVVNDEFCTCLNEDPVDCFPLAEDQYTVALRVPQADPLFRSRISRETQALVEGLGEADEDEDDEGDEGEGGGRP